MSKKQNKVKISPIKIVALIIILIGIFTVTVGVVEYATRDTVYECVRYEQVPTSTSEREIVNDILGDTYSYYTITLKGTSKFILEYKLKETDKVETKEGTYEKKDGKLYLTYKDYNEEQDECIYTINGNNIIRDQFINYTDNTGASTFRGYIRQKFQKQ